MHNDVLHTHKLTRAQKRVHVENKGFTDLWILFHELRVRNSPNIVLIHLIFFI